MKDAETYFEKEHSLHDESEQQCCSHDDSSQELTPLERCQQEMQEWKTKWRQVSADFDNFKKRADKERVQWISTGQEIILLEVLSIMDDLERAFTEAKKRVETPEGAALVQGIEMINANINKILSKYGVKEIDQIAHFNPDLHEALLHIDSSAHQSGDIVGVLQKGFTFKDSVLRPAKVSVAK